MLLFDCVHECLQLCAGGEFWPFAGGNLNCFAGLRIPTSACFGFRDTKRAKANQLHCLALRKRTANNFKHGVDYFTARHFRMPCLQRKRFDQICFVQCVLQNGITDRRW